MRGQRDQTLEAVTTPLAVTALDPGCTLCLLLWPLSSGSWGACLRSAHSACSGKVQQSVLSSLLLLLCALVPCDKDIPKGHFALKGSGFRRAPTLPRFAVPLQVPVQLLSWGSCLSVRAAAQEEQIILPSFITG